MSIEAHQRRSSHRRQKALQIPRSKLLDADSFGSHEIMDIKSEAAATLQRWYRRTKLRAILKVFKRFGVDRTSLADAGFNAAVRKMQSQPVIRCVGLFLIRAKKLSTTKIPTDQWKNPARVLLSSYMLCPFDASSGPQENVR